MEFNFTFPYNLLRDNIKMISYCYECGVKLEYPASAKPKFCHNCGSPTGEGEARGECCPRGHEGVPGVRGEERAEDEDENLRVPQNLTELEFEVSFAESQTFKLGDIMEQSVRETETAGEIGGPLNIPDRKGKRTSKKKVLDQFKREAGTLRQNPRKK